MYRAGCRCEECTAAQSDYNHRWYRKRQQALGKTIRPRRWARHGTNSKYTMGCRCDECREAHRLYRAEQNRREGIGPRSPGAPLRPLVECLVASPLKPGLTRKKIAAAAGCSETTLRLKRKTVNRKTAEAIERLHWGLWRRYGPFRSHCRCEVPEYVLSSLEAA